MKNTTDISTLTDAQLDAMLNFRWVDVPTTRFDCEAQALKWEARNSLTIELLNLTGHRFYVKRTRPAGWGSSNAAAFGIFVRLPA